MSLFESAIQQSPVLSAILGTIAVLLAILLLGAAISNLSDRRRRSARERYEPTLGDDVDRVIPDEYTYVPLPSEPPPGRRRGFGFGTLLLTFLVGALAGAVAVVGSSKGFTTVLHTLSTLVDLDQTAVGSEAPAGVAPPGGPAVPSTEPSSEGPDEDIGLQLQTFAEGLKRNLPRAAGPELSLTDVDVTGRTVKLAYAVAREMDEAETTAFDAYIARTVRSLFCGSGSREIRQLNENGVEFQMKYVDPRGKTVTAVTVAPDFCA